MERYRIERPGTVTPGAAGAEMTLLAEMGLAHERQHVASLRAAGSDMWEPPSTLGDFEARHRATLDAMRGGRDIIYQGALGHGDFAGYSDFLHRVARPSKLGAFRYEVSDTKLARNPKPYFLLQLCAYAKMLEHLRSHYASTWSGPGAPRVIKSRDPSTAPCATASRAWLAQDPGDRIEIEWLIASERSIGRSRSGRS